MVEIEWASPAFKVLETLPQRLAFNIVARTDLLAEFSQQGTILQGYHHLGNPFRQLIYKGIYRVVYLFAESQNRLYIIALQNCRQVLPPVEELRMGLE